MTSYMSETTLFSASNQKCTEQLVKKTKQHLQKAWFCPEKFRTPWMLTPKSKFGEVARKDQYTKSALAKPFVRKWSSKAAPEKLQHTEREPVLQNRRAGLCKGISRAHPVPVKSQPSFWQSIQTTPKMYIEIQGPRTAKGSIESRNGSREFSVQVYNN